MALALLREIALEETYEDMVSDLDRLAKRFWRQYGNTLFGITFDEVRAEVDHLFVEAYHKHDHRRGPFPRHLSYVVPRRLFDKYIRQPAFARARRRAVPVDISRLPARRDRLRETLFELSSDAQTVASIVCTSPADLRLAVGSLSHVLSSNECQSPAAIKTALRAVLSDLGWTATRITESFNEISGAL